MMTIKLDHIYASFVRQVKTLCIFAGYVKFIYCGHNMDGPIL